MITASQSLGTLNYLQAKKWQFYWLCALIASFSYDRSLIYLTPYDRTNPRLFDLVVIIGVVTILPHLGRQPAFPRPFRIWVALVLWFCVCAILWAIMLPWALGIRCLFSMESCTIFRRTDSDIYSISNSDKNKLSAEKFSSAVNGI